MSRTAIIAIISIAVLYTIHGFVPGRVLVPADIPHDLVAWKGLMTTRVRVSNSLLSDVAVQFIPWDMEASRLLRQGKWPWRNRFADDGAPLFANPQAALLSPFTWPRLLFGLRGWVMTLILKLLVAGFGMYWLARTIGLADEASILSAIVFAWCGFATTLAFHPHTNVFVILPAFCAAVLSRRLVSVALIAALLTGGGHPETLFVGVVSVFVFVLLNRPVRSVGAVVVASFAGFLLLAVQIVPFFVLMWNSHARAARPTELPAHFRALTVVGTILPGALGSPLRNELDLTAVVPNAENFIARSAGYIGALSLLAIVFSLRALPQAVRRGLAIGAAGFGLALWIPGLRDVLRSIPVVKWIAFDFFSIPFALFGSLAAGPALVELTRGKERRVLASVIIGAGASLVIAGSLPAVAPDLLDNVAQRGIAHLQARGHLHQPPSVYAERFQTYLAAAKWTAIRRGLMPGLCWVAFGIGMFMRRRTVIYAAALAELGLFGYGFAPSIRIDEIAGEPAVVTQIKRLDPERQYFTAAALDTFPANLGTLFQIRQLDSYDVLTAEASTRSLVHAGYDPFFHGFASRPPLETLAPLGVRFWIDEKGLTEIPNASLPAPPRQGPPGGFLLGLGGTIAGLALLVALAIRPRRS